MEEREDNTICKLVVPPMVAVLDMAGVSRTSFGLEGSWEIGFEGRMPGIHQRGLDRHAAAQV